MMDEEELAHIVIGKSIEIHKTLGPGLSKANYIQCLKSELNDENIQFESMVEQEVYYKDRILPDGNPIDFIIEDMLIVNILTVAQIYEHEIQRTLKVVRSRDYRLGFVINFNSTLLKNGIRRVSNHKNSLPE